MSGKPVASPTRSVDRGDHVSRVFAACLDASNDPLTPPAAERDICVIRVAGELDLSNGARAMASRLGLGRPAVRVEIGLPDPNSSKTFELRSPSES